jgi:hypothetical protein
MEKYLLIDKLLNEKMNSQIYGEVLIEKEINELLNKDVIYDDEYINAINTINANIRRYFENIGFQYLDGGIIFGNEEPISYQNNTSFQHITSLMPIEDQQINNNLYQDNEVIPEVIPNNYLFEVD